MSEENVESFRRGTEAYNRREVDELLKTLDRWSGIRRC